MPLYDEDFLPEPTTGAGLVRFEVRNAEMFGEEEEDTGSLRGKFGVY